MQHFEYRPRGVCSRQISFDLDGDVVRNVHFVGGCPGNLQGISRAVDGMTVSQIEKIFCGIDCGGKGTSCPDQLAALVRRGLDEQQS